MPACPSWDGPLREIPQAATNTPLLDSTFGQKVGRRNSERVDVMDWHTVLLKTHHTHPMIRVTASMRDPNDTSCNPHKEPKSPFYPFQIQDHASLSGLMSRESKSRTLGMSNSIGVFCGLLLVIRKTTSRLDGKCCWVCHQGQAAPESSKNRVGLPNILIGFRLHQIKFMSHVSCMVPSLGDRPMIHRALSKVQHIRTDLASRSGLKL